MSIQIIEENRKPTTIEKFGNAFSGANKLMMQALGEQMQKERQSQQLAQENDAIKRMGLDLSGIKDPNLRQKAFQSLIDEQSSGRLLEKEYKLKGGIEKNKILNESNEKIAPLQGALDIINKMRSLRQGGRLGFGSSVLGYFDPQTRRDSGEYEQLGKSLIQYATNIPIRNKLEFETLAEKLYDPTITDAEADGILNAMQTIVSNSLQQYAPQSMTTKPQSSQTTNRPPLTDFD